MTLSMKVAAYIASGWPFPIFGKTAVSALQSMEVVAADAHKAGASTNAGCSSGRAVFRSSHGHRVCSALGMQYRATDESWGISGAGSLGSHSAP